MSGDDRTEWLKVAQMTLCDVPADLLARGCNAARRTCDHPSKVVPAILAEIGFAMSRRDELRSAIRGPQTPALPPRSPDPEYVDPSEVRALIQSIGIN